MARRKKNGDRLVYSTDGSHLPKRRGDDGPAPVLGDGQVRVRREKKGRKGKTVSVITGLPLAAGELSDLATELKRRCGSGGSVKEGAIEIQGDHVDELVAVLVERGYQAKRAGG